MCFQTFDSEKEQDAKILKLLDVLGESYGFLSLTEASPELHMTEALSRTLEATLKQTIECGIYVLQYCENNFTGPCALLSTITFP